MEDKKVLNAARTSGKNISYWIDSTEPIIYDRLTEDLNLDCAVIGGGIAGVTTAYFLAKAGRKTALFEDGFIGSGETGRTTAHITPVLDDRYFGLEKVFSTEDIFRAAESHTLATNFIEQVYRDENFECDFERVDGYLFRHPSDDKENMDKEYESTMRAALEPEFVDKAPGIQNVNERFIKFANQAMFHPLKYLKGMCEAIVKSGGKIYTQTHVHIKDNNTLTVHDKVIKADTLVVATNTPINDRFKMHTKQAPFRTYVIAVKVKKGIIPYALWWDTGDHNSKWSTYPYHYVRMQRYNDEYDLMIIGGEDHKTGQAMEENIPEEDRYDRLYSWAKLHFPQIEEIEYHWSGQVMEPVDSLAFIGKNPGDDNVYIATGDSGNGITHGTLAGIIISDMILGKHNKYDSLYDPARKSLRTLDVYTETQFNVLKQYAKGMKKGDIETFREIKASGGAIIEYNGDKIAVFRDEDGRYHTFSAVCPHMKCILSWNNDEKSFDCPCHGSRFSCFGRVVNGPAPHDLESVDIVRIAE